MYVFACIIVGFFGTTMGDKLEIKELELDKKLEALEYTNIQVNSAIGSLVAKIVKPSSDSKAYHWLSKVSGVNELIGCDFNQMSSSNIYRVADKLNSHKDEIEELKKSKDTMAKKLGETIVEKDFLVEKLVSLASSKERKSLLNTKYNAPFFSDQ